MDTSRVDLVLKYALAVASREEWGRRDLGAIHLLKLVYLADLAHAQAHDGETFTGAPWRFYKFGPWTESVYERIPAVLAMLGATEQRVSSPRTPEEVIRYSVDDPDLFDDLDRHLPLVVARSVKRAVHEFGDDTAGLLEYVYRTPPMMRAAPGETLDFRTLVRPTEATEPAVPVASEQTTPTRRQEKKRAERMAAARERLRAAFEARRTERSYVQPVPPPRYDAVYDEGAEWLDELAGEHVRDRGELKFDDSIWKSAARGDADTP
ncbi:MAG TPA: hypothetical protein VIV57_16540 [Anaeromyxobacter sp.]